MLTFSKVNSTSIVEGFREIKVEEYGVKTADLCEGFGIDSNPIAGMTAIFSETSNDGDAIIVGYVDTRKIAAEGETRLFSLDSEGNEKAFVWLKNNGQLELNGKGDNVVRYSELEKMMSKLKSDINVELAKIQTGIIGAKSSYAKKDIAIDSSKCKVDNVEVKSP